jgi:hypothetical protein
MMMSTYFCVLSVMILALYSSVCICMYIYTHTHIHAHIYGHTHTHTYVQVASKLSAHTYIRIYIFKCASYWDILGHIYMHTYIHKWADASCFWATQAPALSSEQIYMRVHRHHIHTHRYIHTYIHTYIHKQLRHSGAINALAVSSVRLISVSDDKTVRWMHTCIHTCIYIRSCTHVCVYACMYVYVYIHTHSKAEWCAWWQDSNMRP